MHKCLYLGGARSGKSRLAQIRAEAAPNVVFIATAQGLDAEMTQRIEHHRSLRPRHWQVIEEPIHLANALYECDQNSSQPLILVDCLTLWLSNLLCSEDDERYLLERTKLLTVVTKLRSPLVLVSNEVGLGLIAPTALGRRFVDEAGRLHQDLANICDEVIWVAAGLPMWLKKPVSEKI
ncbi:MAG TPA: bifunctional adenosylcobinamide kinase/adenosylcobinamide-phosphate guanylyltransferase [Cellvibrionaceae bacterium]